MTDLGRRIAKLGEYAGQEDDEAAEEPVAEPELEPAEDDNEEE